MIFLLAHLKVRLGTHPELLESARAMSNATRAEPGCILYALNVSVTDPQTMIFVEHWESREALTAHLKTLHMAGWRKASEGYFLERRIEIIHPDKVEVLRAC